MNNKMLISPHLKISLWVTITINVQHQKSLKEQGPVPTGVSSADTGLDITLNGASVMSKAWVTEYVKWVKSFISHFFILATA